MGWKRLPWVLAVAVIGCAGYVLLRHWLRDDPNTDYGLAAGRYDEYAKAYESYAEGKQSFPLETCYGGRWNDYAEFVASDLIKHQKESDYLKQKSLHFSRLKRKYEEAAANPGKPIVLDPPLVP
jgi:hypothetical protein